MPERLAIHLCAEAGVGPAMKLSQVPKEGRIALLSSSFALNVSLALIACCIRVVHGIDGLKEPDIGRRQPVFFRTLNEEAFVSRIGSKRWVAVWCSGDVNPSL